MCSRPPFLARLKQEHLYLGFYPGYLEFLITHWTHNSTSAQINNSKPSESTLRKAAYNTTRKQPSKKAQYTMKRSHSCISLSRCHNDEWESDTLDNTESEAAAAGRTLLRRPKMQRIIISPDDIAVDCMLVLTRVDAHLNLAECSSWHFRWYWLAAHYIAISSTNVKLNVPKN